MELCERFQGDNVSKVFISEGRMFSEKFNYYDDKIADLEKEIIVLKSEINDNPNSEYIDTKQSCRTKNRQCLAIH